MHQTTLWHQKQYYHGPEILRSRKTVKIDIQACFLMAAHPPSEFVFFYFTLAQNGVRWSTHSLMPTIITGSSLTSWQQLSPAEAFSVLTIVTCGNEKVNEITVMHICARRVIKTFPASAVCLDLVFALVLVTFISFEGNRILKTKHLFCPVSNLS